MLPLLLGTLLATSCPVSPVEHPASPVIGPSRGQSPVWLVDGSFGRWSRADEGIKTLFVLSRAASGTLRVTGRRRGGSGELLFQQGVDGVRQPVLEVADPWTHSLIPGGSTPDITRAYAFLGGYVIYPSRGCWDLNVRLGIDETRITIEIK